MQVRSDPSPSGVFSVNDYRTYERLQRMAPTEMPAGERGKESEINSVIDWCRGRVIRGDNKKGQRERKVYKYLNPKRCDGWPERCEVFLLCTVSKKKRKSSAKKYQDHKRLCPSCHDSVQNLRCETCLVTWRHQHRLCGSSMPSWRTPRVLNQKNSHS